LKSKSLKRDFFFSGLTNFSDFFLFLLLILAGRKLGATDFGAFAFAQSVAIIFLTFSNFGLNTLAIRDIAQDNSVAEKYLSNILSWKIILSTVSYILMIISVLYFWDKSKQIVTVVIILGLASAVRFFSMTGRAVLSGFQRFDLESRAVVMEQGFLLLIGGIFLLLGKGILYLAAAFLIARAFGCLYIFLLIKKLTSFSVEFDFGFIYELQKKAIPLGLAILVTTAYIQVNTIIIEHFLSFREVGLYNAAFKIYSGLFLIPSIISSILFPRLANSFLVSKHEHNKLIVKGILSLFVVSVPIFIIGFLFSDNIMVMVFGYDYMSSATTMKILFGVLVVTFQIWLLRIILVSVDKKIILLNINIIGLAALTGFDCLFIPKYGIKGAAIALGCSEVLVFLGIWICLFRGHFRLTSIEDAIKKVFSVVSLKN